MTDLQYVNKKGEKTILVFRSFPLNRDMDTIILFTLAFSYSHYFSVFHNTHPSTWCPSHFAFKFSTVLNPRKSYLTEGKLEFLKENFKRLKHKSIYTTEYYNRTYWFFNNEIILYIVQYRKNKRQPRVGFIAKNKSKA